MLTNKQSLIDLSQGITEEYINSLIPKVDEKYTPWGNYETILKVLSPEGRGINLYITGLSGCGKTKSIEQACAQQGLPLFIVSITSETTESDLIGKYHLENGEMVWHNGPVLNAMLSGGILLLDEIDKGSVELMCLQGVLNDFRVFVKAANTEVVAHENFRVFATANTKGRGDTTGMFISSNTVDEAMLDRFTACLEQDYPDEETEAKILTNATDLTPQDIQILTGLAKRNRISFIEEGSPDVISTRQLLNISKIKFIYKDKQDPLLESIKAAFNRFQEDTMEAILAIYETLYAEVYKEDDEYDEDDDEAFTVKIKDIDGDILNYLGINE